MMKDRKIRLKCKDCIHGTPGGTCMLRKDNDGKKPNMLDCMSGRLVNKVIKGGNI